MRPRSPAVVSEDEFGATLTSSTAELSRRRMVAIVRPIFPRTAPLVRLSASVAPVQAQSRQQKRLGGRRKSKRRSWRHRPSAPRRQAKRSNGLSSGFDTKPWARARTCRRLPVSPPPPPPPPPPPSCQILWRLQRQDQIAHKGAINVVIRTFEDSAEP